MKTFGVLLLLVLSISLAAAATIEWDDLLVKFESATQDPLRLNSHFKIPRNRSDAISARWVRVTGVNSNLVTSYSLKGDPRFIVLFDCHGLIAGFQFGILASDVAGIQDVIQMSASNMYQIKTIDGVDVWTVTIYTQDPGIIATGCHSSRRDNLTGTDGVWIETTDDYVEVSPSLADLDPIWTKQNCVPAMGVHYLYGQHNDSACPDIPPVFVLSNEETITGLGLRGFGKMTIKDRSWYENATTAGIRFAVPDGPECLYDWGDAYGTILMHVFFTSEPWNFTC